ncbi:tRNA glutamyl-Q(34) synthetase GluQRS [Microvirga lotononidis]|uniref:Glutamyl-or glutaminyl-tRNA synthetase n=1 Tax=Microvirga lotononidis TaxID=864069 RepID=I4YTH6_9HYPH|nr:tRNA glutamyl-Q(34) synthetase GluQRS [Microvirga lotononidis]EIM27268.1 glutamyl- or glutaminyl-tRNA synthetase [Microvirga lotononidis]WQO28560.1 tRNA glutamyl-Q(34) synthetase GluQRS [Microvirga lotononidis]
MTKPVFRFAPSPNGRLHLGHAYSALLNADFAHRFGGRFLLRIEDIDITRCRPEFEAAIYDDLAWLGLHWEAPVRRQSEHFADYRAAFQRLKGRGVVYPCFCTRKDIAETIACREAESGEAWPRDPDLAPLYPGTCRALQAGEAERRIAAGEPHAWRLDMAALDTLAPDPLLFRRFDRDGQEEVVTAHPRRWGDAVIVRKEIPTSYHLSVVVDDALQGITHVVRGQDLEAATDLHVLLQTALDLPTPRYHHHGLLRDPEGDKLAKSRRSKSLAELRAEGATPQDLWRRLGFGRQPTPST